LGIDPTLDIISASASGDLATEFGAAVRDTIKSPEYKDLFPKTEMSESSQAKGRWQTAEGGGYYAVGIGGILFGRGAGVAIVDDPFATWEDSQSTLAKARVWDWYRGTLYNRVRPAEKNKPGGAIIIIQHRTGEDDLVGRLLEEEKHGGDKWTVVNLKADLEDPPWPERYNREALERIRANISPMMWSALYLQNPIPDDGTFFKKDWFTDYEELPKGLKIYGATDGAVSKGEGDFTEHGIIGVDTSRNIYVLDWWYGQESADVWIDKMADLVNEHEPSCWFGESGPIRKAVEPFMVKRLTDRDAFVRIEWIPSIQDKETRATGIQGLMSMGKVFWPKNAKWKAHVQEQMLRFPAGKYDDAVDVMGLFGRGLKFVNSSKKRVVRRIMEPVRSWMAG
jgi:predicted phage terminase large subunit-like protein